MKTKGPTISTSDPTSSPSTKPSKSPTDAPVVAQNCGLCEENISISCESNADCPTIPLPGTCSAPTPQPTWPPECTNDNQCEPNNGKQSRRGVCNSGGMGLSICNPDLCPPTQNPTPFPTRSPSKFILMLCKCDMKFVLYICPPYYFSDIYIYFLRFYIFYTALDPTQNPSKAPSESPSKFARNKMMIMLCF